MKGLNINKKLLKRLTIVPILFICYVLLLNPEVILEEECPKMQKNDPAFRSLSLLLPLLLFYAR
ncbi:hypothetical protein SAMN05192538_2635 [Bacillus velezensis]|nr:hypothetical protein BCBMB205_25110 [Bacillus velezensis]APQ51958.1 hypothetical protein BSO20_19120 [Bacillus amyloliquefaciens]QJC42739.1 hypothetical protein FHJ82_12395 [Bacillus sp. HNA3]GFR55867.1 hypothetical protein BCBMB205_25110 [Bacillus sp. CN2]ARZ58853.1 hypothetical protein BAGQ_2621 [Bacillus velezensis]